MKDAVLTFDLEDWFQLTSTRFGISPGRLTRGRLRSQVSHILDLLSENDAQATFFILGKTAQSCPEVVTEVCARGHEVASHGYGHELVRTLDPERFRKDLQASIDLLTDLCGQRPKGYRAPEFSIDRNSFWAFDVMLDCGIEYDSSIFPIRGPRYGVPDAPLGPHKIRTPSGREIAELPLAVLELFGQRMPIAGGGYWRLLPAPVIDWALGRIAATRSPMLYFHPAEFDTRPLNLSLRSLAMAKFTLKQNLGRASISAKLGALLAKHHCVSAERFHEALQARGEAAMARARPTA